MRIHKSILAVATAFLCCCCSSFGVDYQDEMKRKALAGDRDAQATLSYLYRSGKGVPKDLEKARKWERLGYQNDQSPARSNVSSYRGTSNRESSLSRLPPRRPESNLIAAPRPQRPILQFNHYSPNASVRLPPTRPGEQFPARSFRASPRRNSQGNVARVERTYDSRFRYERLASNAESYRRIKRKPHNQLIKGGRILFSPITLTLKKSKKAVSKVARKMAWASVVP